MNISFRRSLTLLSLLFITVAAMAQQYQSLKAPLTFIVANDLGRNGYYEQKPVAELMGRVADEVSPEAVIAAGDVFHYMGVQSTNDPLWYSNFENIYTHPELQISWLTICGNHEYRGNTSALIEYSAVSRRWQMESRYYTQVFESKKTSVRLIMLDTTPLIDKYRQDTDKYPDAHLQDAQAQLEWLENTLATSTEQWIIVVGHHPIFADTDKDESERADMQKVNHLLKKYRADFYICGHIHNFQHLRSRDSSVDYIVNTSGSLAREVHPIAETKFCYSAEGFSVISASRDNLTLSMINQEGNIIYKVSRK